MKKIAKLIIFVVVAFIFSVLLGGAFLNAETVIKEQLDGSLLIKERTEMAIMELAPLPNGVGLDLKNPDNTKVIIQLWNKSLPEVVIGGKSETRILNLFPIVVKVITGEKRLRLVGSEWSVDNLPDRKEAANKGYTVILILGLVIVFTSFVIISTINRLHDKAVKLLLLCYGLMAVVASVAMISDIAAVYNIGLLVLLLASVIAAFIAINFATSKNVTSFIIPVIAACCAVIGNLANVLITTVISLSGDKGVGCEYFLFIIIAEAVSFVIAMMVKNIHDKQKPKVIGKPAEGVMTNY